MTRSQSQTSGLRNPFKRKKSSKTFSAEIDPLRAESHRIYDIQELLGVQTFIRNCKSFKYTVKKGKKVYKPKACELKIEEYTTVKGQV